MSPEERQEFEDLQRKVEDLSRPENAMKIERVIFNDDLVVDNTQVERTASVSGGEGETLMLWITQTDGLS